MIEKYTRLHIRRNIITVLLVCVLLIIIPVLIASLHLKALTFDPVVILIVLAIAVIGLLTGQVQTRGFRKMIVRQEDRYLVRFSDTGAERLESTLYLSKDWLIWAGVIALYRLHIRSGKRKNGYGIGAGGNIVELIDADGKKHAIRCFSVKSADKVAEWLNEKDIDI